MLVIGSWQYSGGLSGFHSVGGGHDGLKDVSWCSSSHGEDLTQT